MWQQGDVSLILDTVSANEDGDWQLTVGVPPKAEVGTAEISVDNDSRVEPVVVKVIP